MTNPLSPNDIERLRREAKKLSQQEGITHTEALNREAVKLGYPNWALLHRAFSIAPKRYPVFLRTAEEMHAAFRKSKGLDGMRKLDDAIRERMPDLSVQFANPMSALEYARAYLELALSLPRFDPQNYSLAQIEMRVLLPYVLEPLVGTDRFIILGRDYKPLGMANRNVHIDYELYRNLHVRVPRAELHQVTKHPDYSPGYLYAISPYKGRKYASALSKQLEKLIELIGRYER